MGLLWQAKCVFFLILPHYRCSLVLCVNTMMICEAVDDVWRDGWVRKRLSEHYSLFLADLCGPSLRWCPGRPVQVAHSRWLNGGEPTCTQRLSLGMTQKACGVQQKKGDSRQDRELPEAGTTEGLRESEVGGGWGWERERDKRLQDWLEWQFARCVNYVALAQTRAVRHESSGSRQVQAGRFRRRQEAAILSATRTKRGPSETVRWLFNILSSPPLIKNKKKKDTELTCKKDLEWSTAIFAPRWLYMSLNVFLTLISKCLYFIFSRMHIVFQRHF